MAYEEILGATRMDAKSISAVSEPAGMQDAAAAAAASALLPSLGPGRERRVLSGISRSLGDFLSGCCCFCSQIPMDGKLSGETVVWEEMVKV